MHTVFSCYPLTAEAGEKVAALGPSAGTLTLSTLRAMSPGRIWSTLRAVESESVCVVVGEPTERTVLPMMLLLSALTRAERIEVFQLSSGERRTVSWLRAIMSVFPSLLATIAGRVVKLRAERETKHLMRAGPIDFAQSTFERALYLKSNLMLGTTAGGSVGHVAGVANEIYRRLRRLVVLGLEFPATVDPGVEFVPIEPLASFGAPPESNHLRFDRQCYRAAGPILARGEADFIYQRLSVANFTGVRLSREYGVPLILEYNGSEVWIAQHWGLKMAWAKLGKRIEQVCFRHAHRIVTVSQVLADELRAEGVQEDKIVCYPNCIDPLIFDPDRLLPDRATTRKSLGLEPDDLVCTFIGTFGTWHGAEVLAEAIVRLRDNATARRLRFLMIGDGLRAAACKKILAPEIASGRAIFTGLIAQAHAPAYLAASDIFLSPQVAPADGSQFFGSPTKLFEYMAMSKPIVASALAQMADVLQPSPRLAEARERAQWPDGDIAILTEPGSVAEIVDSLLLLAHRPDWHDPMGRAGRVKALSDFTWQRHVDVIFESLKK